MTDQNSTKPYNIEPHIESALCYLPLIGIAVLLVEKENRITRFHAFRSIFFWIVAFALISMVNAVKILLVGLFLSPLVNLMLAGLWLYLIWKTYNKELVELPIIGRIAKEQAEK